MLVSSMTSRHSHARPHSILEPGMGMRVGTRGPHSTVVVVGETADVVRVWRCGTGEGGEGGDGD